MGTKKSLFLSDQAVDIINLRNRYDDDFNWSQSVSDCIVTMNKMYEDILSTVDLTTDQWVVIFDTFNGHIFNSNIFIGIATCIMDNNGCLDVDKLEPDMKELVLKVNAYSVIQQRAIIELARRFWSNKFGEDFENYDEIIQYLKTGYKLIKNTEQEESQQSV